jgi:RNA polymerase sigma-B factor
MLKPSAAPVSGCRDQQRERVLLERYSRSRDPYTRGVLVERFMPLARSLARRYECRGEPLDDLVQVASLGLVKAIDRFDPGRGHAFSSFAVPTIVGEVKRHLRDHTWLVRPPRGLQELALQIDRAARELAQELDRQPTVRELAATLCIDEEHVVEALQARSARSALSLDAQSYDPDGGTMLQDRIGGDDDGFELAEARATLAGMLAMLPATQREILRMRFGEDMTQSEIGGELGISQMQVSRLLRAAIARLREIADQQARRAQARRHAGAALVRGRSS